MRKTLQGWQEEVDTWIKSVGVRYFEVMTNTALLNEETGELSGLLARYYGEQSFKKDPPERKEGLGDEMADVLFVLLCLANQTGVDLGEALTRNLEKKTARDAERHKNNPKLK